MRSANPDQAPPLDEIIGCLRTFPIDLLKIYPSSFCLRHGSLYGLIRTPEGKKMVVIGDKKDVLKDAFHGNCHHHTWSLKVCDLSAENTGCLMTLFPFTKPVSLRDYSMTIGTEDYLGLATPGYIRAIKKFQVHPVLGQLSVAEIAQTGRDFAQVIQDTAWAVFQENYQGGYGADADHLNSVQEVKSALDAGVSMITLDLSEKINRGALEESKERIERKFREEIDEGDAEVLLHLFLNKEFLFAGPHGKFSIRFNEESVRRNSLLFYRALGFAEEVYELIRSRTGNRPLVDLEICLEGIPLLTSPENHLFFALELSHRGVHIQFLAPRFIGAFEKGIDHSHGREAFCTQFYRHVLIAQDYGNYKISIHSDSDKFSLLSDIGKLSEGFLHLKTSGTSWLEATRLIALTSPSLYKQMHQFALSIASEASRVYRMRTDLTGTPQLEDLPDQKLPTLLDHDGIRQLLHISYGHLLNAKNEAGTSLFRDQLYHTLTQFEEDYWSLVEKQTDKYLSGLGVKKELIERIERGIQNEQEKPDKDFDL